MLVTSPGCNVQYDPKATPLTFFIEGQPLPIHAYHEDFYFEDHFYTLYTINGENKFFSFNAIRRLQNVLRDLFSGTPIHYEVLRVTERISPTHSKARRLGNRRTINSTKDIPTVEILAGYKNLEYTVTQEGIRPTHLTALPPVVETDDPFDDLPATDDLLGGTDDPFDDLLDGTDDLLDDPFSEDDILC